MLKFNIPGYADSIEVEHLVLDYNGTLATDGKLISGVRELLEELMKSVKIHVVTADTFGQAANELKGINCKIFILASRDEDEQKLEYINELGCENVIAIGNGRNDTLMLESAVISIVVIQDEGAAVFSINAADICTFSIIHALKLLLNPLKLKATLRN